MGWQEALEKTFSPSRIGSLAEVAGLFFPGPAPLIALAGSLVANAVKNFDQAQEAVRRRPLMAPLPDILPSWPEAKLFLQRGPGRGHFDALLREAAVSDPIRANRARREAAETAGALATALSDDPVASLFFKDFRERGEYGEIRSLYGEYRLFRQRLDEVLPVDETESLCEEVWKETLQEGVTLVKESAVYKAFLGTLKENLREWLKMGKADWRRLWKDVSSPYRVKP